MVKTSGNLHQLAGFLGAGNVLQLVVGEGAPLIDVAVLIQAHREGAANRQILGIVLQTGRHIQHAEARGHVCLGNILIVQVNGEEVRQKHAAQENEGKQNHADHGDLIPQEIVDHHLHGALEYFFFLLGHAAHHHLLGCFGGRGTAGGFFLFVTHSFASLSLPGVPGGQRWYMQCP